MAIRDVIAEVGDATVVMSDLCLDEFTSHGHCGVLAADGTVDNDATLKLYAEMAVAQAEAGVHIVGPSGMMDGQVGVSRRALDAAGFQDVSILAYSAKYASAFFGPFREAVESALEGDRRSYQQDPAGNVREAVREAELDIAEGADLVMVKPALPYLDVVAAVRAAVQVPVAAYQVSGEYAMAEAAFANGWLDRDRTILETLTSIRRAGAQQVLTYWAMDAARLLAPRTDRSGGQAGRRRCHGRLVLAPPVRVLEPEDGVDPQHRLVLHRLPGLYGLHLRFPVAQVDQHAGLHAQAEPVATVRRHDDRVVLVGALRPVRRDDEFGQPGDLPAGGVYGNRDVRPQPARGERTQTVPEPVGLEPGVPFHVGDGGVPGDELRVGVRGEQLVGQAVGEVLDVVAGAPAAGEFGDPRPVHRGQVEQAAVLDDGAGEALRGVEVDGGGALDDLGGDQLPAVRGGVPGGGGEQRGADPALPVLRVGEHLDDCGAVDVVAEQDLADVADQIPAGFGDPGVAFLARHGHRQVVAEPLVPPDRFVGQVHCQGGVDGLPPGVDLPVRRAGRVPLSNAHCPCLPDH